jgi:hypothetical protein
VSDSDLARTVQRVWVFGCAGGLTLLVQRKAPPSRASSGPGGLPDLGAGLSILTTALDFLRARRAHAPLGHRLHAVKFLLAQTLQRLRLLDLNELLGKTVALSLQAVLFVGIYAVLVSWTQGLTLFLFNSLVATMVVLILFEPLRAKVEEWVVATMFRERFELIRTLSASRTGCRTSSRCATSPRPSSTPSTRPAGSRTPSIYLLADDRPGFYLVDFRGPAPAPLLEAAQAGRSSLWRCRAEGGPPGERRAAPGGAQGALRGAGNRRGRDEIKRLTDLRGALKLMNAGITVPMMGGDRVVGFFNLWDERVPEAYASNEIALILELGERMATTVENSKLYERMKERDRLAALGDDAAGLAHEIRNPLGAIKGAAQYLSPQELPAGDQRVPQGHRRGGQPAQHRGHPVLTTPARSSRASRPPTCPTW